MDPFDDIQVEETSMFDFVEEMNEALLDEEEDERFSFDDYLNSNYDY